MYDEIETLEPGQTDINGNHYVDMPEIKYTPTLRTITVRVN